MADVGTDGTALLPTRWWADVDDYADVLAWSPDDRRLAAGCEDGGVALFDTPVAKP